MGADQHRQRPERRHARDARPSEAGARALAATGQSLRLRQSEDRPAERRRRPRHRLVRRGRPALQREPAVQVRPAGRGRARLHRQPGNPRRRHQPGRRDAVHELRAAARGQPANLGGVPVHQPEPRRAGPADTERAPEPRQLSAGRSNLQRLAPHRRDGGAGRQARHRPKGRHLDAVTSTTMRVRSLALSGPTGPQKAPGPVAWLLIAPLMLWVVAFVVAPTLIMVVYSVSHRGTLGGVVYGFTLEHYAALFDRTYLQIIARS